MTYRSIGLIICILCIAVTLVVATKSPFGSVYPITGAWFRHRYDSQDWNKTLTQFGKVGGDTLLFRAPSLQPTSRTALWHDPDFSWCYSKNSRDPASCVDEAWDLTVAAGAGIAGWASYKHEQNFSSALLRCPNLDVRRDGGRTYHRLIINVNATKAAKCEMSVGDEVVIIIAASTDQNSQTSALEAAKAHNMTAWLGLPGFPWMAAGSSDEKAETWIPPYLDFVNRTLLDDHHRFASGLRSGLDSVLTGYVVKDSEVLSNVLDVTWYMYVCKDLKDMVRVYSKKLLVAPSIDLRKSSWNATVEDHVAGFVRLNKVTDVIALQESRGRGWGCFYYPHHETSPITTSDPSLAMILQGIEPKFNSNSTYADIYTGSNNEVWSGITAARDKLQQAGNPMADLWLSIDAFEDRRDSPCLPVDTQGSGVAEIMTRTTKARLDKSLAAQGVHPSKAVALAWDPGYTCTPPDKKGNLYQSVLADSARPIITNCSFHSNFNKSVVIIGFNLDGETQGFILNYPDKHGKIQTSHINGYYFELDWGYQHGRLPGLEYIMLWDFLPLQDMAEKGNLQIKAQNSYHSCSFRLEDYAWVQASTTKAKLGRRKRKTPQ